MLDSDNEEDQQEIEKNKRLIKLNQRTGPNYGNTNPKMRKKLRTLNWEHDYDPNLASKLPTHCIPVL